jgi:hypothetical protein
MNANQRLQSFLANANGRQFQRDRAGDLISKPPCFELTAERKIPVSVS